MKNLFVVIISFYNIIVFAQDSITPKWFNLGIQASLVLNSGLSNVYANEVGYKTFNTARTNESKITKENKTLCFGFSGGVEGIFGKSKIIKHLLGINFDYTKSSLHSYTNNIDYISPGSGSRSYIADLNIKRTVQYLVGCYGIKFPIKSFNINMLACYNQAFNKTDIQNGYTKSVSRYSIDSIPIINVKKKSTDTTRFFSLRIRLGYNLKIKHDVVSLFVMRNFNVTNIFLPEEKSYLAPWWYIGVQYIPTLRKK